ncbi:MAG: PEP-CTERM sorting domain-containing protein [Phycisphaerales bacterium]|nr:PEP-CTERM sorting domain-containing protein [Phycisphaerales bacterium]
MRFRLRFTNPVVRVAALAAALALLFAPAAAQATITLGQVDDFQDLTVQNWSGASGFFSNQDGGPAGAGDRYLRVFANQPAGSGSKVATYNQDQWAGDYLTAGVDAVRADIANFGATDLDMRVILLFGAGGDFTSTVPITVPADGVWRSYTFSLAAADMTQVSGIGTLNDTLASVGRLLIRHQSGPPAGIAGGTTGAGVIGIDNITALPEPASLSMLALGALFAARRRR